MRKHYVVAVLVKGEPKYFVDCGWLSEEMAKGAWMGIHSMAFYIYKHPAIILYERDGEYTPFKAVHTCDYPSKGGWYKDVISISEMEELTKR